MLLNYQNALNNFIRFGQIKLTHQTNRIVLIRCITKQKIVPKTKYITINHKRAVRILIHILFHSFINKNTLMDTMQDTRILIEVHNLSSKYQNILGPIRFFFVFFCYHRSYHIVWLS